MGLARSIGWDGKVVPELVSITQDGTSLLVAATQEFASQLPQHPAAAADAAAAEVQVDTAMDESADPAPAPFVWSQQGRDIDLSLPLPPGVGSRDIEVEFLPTRLR